MTAKPRRAESFFDQDRPESPGVRVSNLLNQIVESRPAWMADPRRHCAPIGDYVQTNRFYGDNTGEAICRECPFIHECLQYALDNREAFGVWGGKSERMRRSMLRRRRGAD